MRWIPIVTADGSPTLVHPVHGQACHSRAGAVEEARERYATACRLSEFRGGVLRLLDVGTGIGLNLAAALEAISSIPGNRRPRLAAVSLEKDASVLRAALELSGLGELERWHAPVRAALASALGGGA
jgi:hypothetical protein